MIISASRRTDIPALYPEWFMNRIREGFALVQNPFNSRVFSKVDLSRASVEAIVFWTRNARPMLGSLHELTARGYKGTTFTTPSTPTRACSSRNFFS